MLFVKCYLLIVIRVNVYKIDKQLFVVYQFAAKNAISAQ